MITILHPNRQPQCVHHNWNAKSCVTSRFVIKKYVANPSRINKSVFLLSSTTNQNKITPCSWSAKINNEYSIITHRSSNKIKLLKDKTALSAFHHDWLESPGITAQGHVIPLLLIETHSWCVQAKKQPWNLGRFQEIKPVPINVAVAVNIWDALSKIDTISHFSPLIFQGL